MVRNVQSTVNVRFDSDVGEGSDITLEGTSEWVGSGVGPGAWVGVREFPVLNGVNRSASVGTVVNTGIIGQLTRNEFISFSGDSSSVSYPVDNATTGVQFVFGFDLEGNPLGASQLSFTFTPGSKEIKANRPFIGAIQVSYFASYRLLAYQAEGGSTGGNFGSVGDVFWRRFGTIISVKDEDHALFEIQPATPENFTLRKELYRVTSNVQTNEDGPWEEHEDFQTGGGWTDGPRDGDSLLEYARPHEIGYVIRASAGRYDYQTTTVFLEQGPALNSGFRQVLSARFHSASEFTGTPWEDAFSRITIADVQADIEERWDGFDVTFS